MVSSSKALTPFATGRGLRKCNVLEHLEQLNLNEDYDCNAFGLAFDAYKRSPQKKKRQTQNKPYRGSK